MSLVVSFLFNGYLISEHTKIELFLEITLSEACRLDNKQK